MARSKHIDDRGRIDFKALYQGAESEAALREEEQKAIREKQKAELEAEVEKGNTFMNKLAESIREEKQAQAEARIKEQTEKAFQRVESEIKKELNLDNKADDNIYKNLLEGLKRE